MQTGFTVGKLPLSPSHFRECLLSVPWQCWLGKKSHSSNLRRFPWETQPNIHRKQTSQTKAEISCTPMWIYTPGDLTFTAICRQQKSNKYFNAKFQFVKIPQPSSMWLLFQPHN